MRRFEIANWAERAFTPTRWVLWYGEGYSSTAVLIWADSLESALECLGDHLEGSSFLLAHGGSELSELMGLPKPTIHRLVGVLLNSGALQTEEGRNRGYSMGRRMWRILQLGRNPRVVENYAQIVCDRLTEQIRETCYIVKLAIAGVETIARAVPDQGYRLHVLPGEELPAHAASSAKAILAYQDEALIQQVLREPLPKLTERTVTDIQEVKRLYEQVRQNGYAVCDREIDPGVVAYSCPVFTDGNQVLYSVGVTGPLERLAQHAQEYWIEALQDGARQFAQLLQGVQEQ